MKNLTSRICALAVVCAASVFGQGSTGSITGIVSDASSARLPGAAIEVRNLETGVAISASANEAGEYTVPLLQPGRYQLTARMDGFRTYSQTGLVIELGRVTRLDIALELGQVSETVEVVGSAPLLESESSTVGQFIENKTVTDMPLNGRRAGELVALMGNAVTISKGVIRPRISVAGGRGDQQQWMIDGVNASNVGLENPQALFNPPVEAVQEMRVQQNGYSAEFGNSSGGVITISTRSGTNDLHGALYEFVRNEKVDARNFFAADKAPLRWNVFGFAVGGPIIKNKTFFFVHNEWQKQRIGVTQTLTVPTALQRAGDFSGTTNAAGALTRIFDPYSGTTRTQYANNVIPASQLDPVAVNLMAFYPEPNRAASNLAGANNFVGNRTNALNLSTLTLKIDHVFSQKDRFTFRHILHDFPTNNTAVFARPEADPSGNTSDRRAFSYLFTEMHNFAPTVINEVRANIQPRRFTTFPLDYDAGWPQQLGLQGVTGTAFPRVNASGFTALGATNHGRIQQPIWDHHFVDSLSWFKGAHSVKMGGEFRYSRNAEDFNQWESGVLTFQPQGTNLPGTGNTGNALASMLAGWVHRGQVRKLDRVDRHASYYAAFVQDDWKVRSNFTLNLGLRWETHTPRVDANNRQNGFDPTATNPVCDCPGVITFAGLDGQGRTIYDGDYNNFGPRVGLAWQPFGHNKTVVRSGYGIFFGPPVPGSNNMAAGFSIDGDFLTPDNGRTAPFLLQNGFPSVARADLGPAFGAVAPGESPIFSPQFIDKNRQLGYSQMWNLSIQHTLGASTIFEASYLGNVGHKLPGPSIAVNQVDPSLWRSGNMQALRPFPQFNAVTSVAPMWGNSSYHGLNLKLEKRFSHGLNFLANYTYAKFIDDTYSGQEAGESDLAMQNLYDRAAEKALSGNDVRNRLVWSSVYEIPLGKGRAMLNQGPLAMILGGWNFGTIVTLQQGSPMGLTTQTNGLGSAFTPGPQRVNVLRDPALPSGEQTVERFFDTDAVAAPGTLVFGNSSRALLTGPGIINFDVSMLKNHSWGERYNVQFRFEAFNFFNRANFNEPGRALGAPTFGVISSAADPRSLQFGLKFAF
ncbi:MAG: TonB-dependent receptor [Acidobacteria bacterium]|nr:TonB-dependent receptor [Acidobacteriota bacterium]